jgi:hypothetical protein
MRPYSRPFKGRNRDETAQHSWSICNVGGRISLSFDASGRYIEVMAARGRPKAGRNSPADAVKAAAQGVVANFGTWSANDADKIITRHREGALFPNAEGTDTKDTASLAGDELRLVDADPNPFAGASVYRRAK